MTNTYTHMAVAARKGTDSISSLILHEVTPTRSPLKQLEKS